MSLKGAWAAVVVSVLMVAGCATGNGGQPPTSPSRTSDRTSGPGPTDVPTGSTAHQRPLTTEETELVRAVFGDSVDCSVVLVHNHAYPLFGGFQPDDTAVTPNGEMYFPAPSYLPDFSAGSSGSARWFVHEMVHVWQHQLGYPVSERGMDRASLRYDDLDRCGADRCRLADHDMEQQGEIVADYAALTILGQATSGSGRYSTADLARYQTVLADFPADPADLPRHQGPRLSVDGAGRLSSSAPCGVGAGCVVPYQVPPRGLVVLGARRVPCDRVEPDLGHRTCTGQT